MSAPALGSSELTFHPGKECLNRTAFLVYRVRLPLIQSIVSIHPLGPDRDGGN